MRWNTSTYNPYTYLEVACNSGRICQEKGPDFVSRRWVSGLSSNRIATFTTIRCPLVARRDSARPHFVNSSLDRKRQ